MKKIFLYLVKKLKILILGISISLSANYGIAHEIEITTKNWHVYSQITQTVYIENHLKFFDFHVRKIEKSYADDDIGISISVKNLGTRTIERIEIIVFFLDHNGIAFFEEEYAIVNKSNGLLKPNYTRRMYPKKYYPLDEYLLGDEWSGKAKYEIQEIIFSE